MEFWFWVKFAIAVFILFGLAAAFAPTAFPQTILSMILTPPPEPPPVPLKACQAKYAFTVEQLTTAAVAIDTGDRRQVVMDLAAAVQHSYDLLAADPAHAAEALCAPHTLADLDGVIASLREAAYLPDHGERAPPR